MGAPISATPLQMHLLRFIAGFIEWEGRTPHIREMQDGLGHSSHSAVFGALRGLEERGHIRREPARPGKCRPIEIVGAVPVPRAPDGDPLYFVPVKSRVDHGVDHG